MKTLYVRIIVMTMVIMVCSSIIAFIVSNVYYHYYLKTENDQKMTNIARNIVDVYEENDDRNIQQYLNSMTDLGYQFYLVNEAGEGEMYGDSFRETYISEDVIQMVIEGHIYHGIAEYPWKLFVTGFFSNELKNTVGTPLTIQGETYALFARQSTSQQFGEMRIFLVLLLVLLLLFSFLMVLISTRFIVKPIQRLTEATKKIAAGNYHIKLKNNRHDEIGRLADHFSMMSDSLGKTEEKRQTFVSNVSHEIQSPLTSIQGFSQALREEELSEGDRSYYLSIIEKESRRLSLLSKQLLTLSFLDGHAEQVDQLAYQVRDQLKEVIATTKWSWREKDIAIELNVSPDLEITGDPKLLHQVWLNLMTNAIRYNKEGGSIVIEAVDHDKHIDIHFTDEGIGMDEAELTNIFDRFYIVDKARTRTKTSTGLGLAITKKIIELHKGTIMVESKRDQGSTFVVSLPKHA